MKIAVLGGGMTGLTVAYGAAEKGYDVTLFEKAACLGGLAAGFRGKHWDWPLEKTYHHLFSNDTDIIQFAHGVGFHGIFFERPLTASYYESGTYPLNTLADFLSFPLLSYPRKLQNAAVIAFLKLSPFLKLYEQMTAQEFLTKTMGHDAWNILWRQLFRKKFGIYTGNILASFIWSRIKKRTRQLGYMRGGFQAFIDHLEKQCVAHKVIIRKNHAVVRISQRGEKIAVDEDSFDSVIATVPTPILIGLTRDFFPAYYVKQLSQLRYLHAHNLIIETRQQFLKNIYWLNVLTQTAPFTVLTQHTNFVDRKNYNGHHLLYVGNYLEKDHPLIRMNTQEVMEHFTPHLKKITNVQPSVVNAFLFKGPFAQPIFDSQFIKNKPDFETPIKNFFIANLDMTYPHDRGTNYAVKLGRAAADLI